ncbi:hypothetical protein RSAG8_11734, partial [Rhizoctonia solani AG-8 WAC10335]
MLVRTNTDLEGVKEHARLLKCTQMMTHDAIIVQRPVQLIQANKGRRVAPFKQGDKVFFSTKNMAILEGKFRKVKIAKCITYRLNLLIEPKRRGIKVTFHASLLKPHIPHEDHRFSRHDYQRFVRLEGDEEQWAVEKINNHRGEGNRAMFEILGQGGEIIWEPYKAIKHLEAYKQYLEALGNKRTSQLPLREDIEIDENSDENLSRIRAQESREQRLWDLNHDRGYPPPDYYGQREPQNKPPVTYSAAPGEPSQEGHRLDETKLAIDKILNASSDLEVLLGRAHTRLGTLAFLTAGLERDLSTGPNPIISVPCLANSMNKSFVPQVNEASLPAPELRSSGIQLDSPFSLPQTLIMDTRLRASIVPNFRGSDIASLAPCS